jgi:hypothetical protein
MATEDFLSARDGAARTGFNLRFASLVPSASRWWTLMIGASVTPYGVGSGANRSDNSPVLFVGNSFRFVEAIETAGWLSVEVPVLMTYRLGEGGEKNTRPFGRGYAAELALNAHLGRKVFSEFGSTLSRLTLYAVAHQTLTPNRDFTGRRDRFRPVAYYGVTLPFGRRGVP